MVSVTGGVDLTGGDTESHLAVRLRALETPINASPAVAGTVLSLSAPDEPTFAVYQPARSGGVVAAPPVLGQGLG